MWLGGFTYLNLVNKKKSRKEKLEFGRVGQG